MAVEPRVRPRTSLEALVDTEKHPPRREIPTKAKDEDRLHWTSVVALVAIFTFWVSGAVAGVLAAIHPTWGLGPLGLAISSLVVSWRIEAE